MNQVRVGSQIHVGAMRRAQGPSPSQTKNPAPAPSAISQGRSVAIGSSDGNKRLAHGAARTNMSVSPPTSLSKGRQAAQVQVSRDAPPLLLSVAKGKGLLDAPRPPSFPTPPVLPSPPTTPPPLSSTPSPPPGPPPSLVVPHSITPSPPGSAKPVPSASPPAPTVKQEALKSFSLSGEGPYSSIDVEQALKELYKDLFVGVDPKAQPLYGLLEAIKVIGSVDKETLRDVIEIVGKINARVKKGVAIKEAYPQIFIDKNRIDFCKNLIIPSEISEATKTFLKEATGSAVLEKTQEERVKIAKDYIGYTKERHAAPENALDLMSEQVARRAGNLETSKAKAIKSATIFKSNLKGGSFFNFVYAKTSEIGKKAAISGTITREKLNAIKKEFNLKTDADAARKIANLTKFNYNNLGGLLENLKNLPRKSGALEDFGNEFRSKKLDPKLFNEILQEQKFGNMFTRTKINEAARDAFSKDPTLENAKEILKQQGLPSDKVEAAITKLERKNIENLITQYFGEGVRKTVEEMPAVDLSKAALKHLSASQTDYADQELLSLQLAEKYGADYSLSSELNAMLTAQTVSRFELVAKSFSETLDRNPQDMTKLREVGIEYNDWLARTPVAYDDLISRLKTLRDTGIALGERNIEKTKQKIKLTSSQKELIGKQIERLEKAKETFNDPNGPFFQFKSLADLAVLDPQEAFKAFKPSQSSQTR